MVARIRQLSVADDNESDEAFSTATPPVTRVEVRTLEEQFGHRLPPSVTELYTQIANGGFGPSYGLMRLDEAKALYDEFRAPDANDPHWRWPEAVLPLVSLGCGMYFCVDCVSDDARVVWFEPNPHVPGESWSESFASGPPFETLMRRWAAGTDTLELMEAFAAEAGAPR